MITTALVVYFSLPAAVTAGAFRREVAGGQLDSLSTLPGKCGVGKRMGMDGGGEEEGLQVDVAL